MIATNFQQEPESLHPDTPDALRPAVPTAVSDTIRLSSVMKKVNMLRSDVEGLKREVSFLTRNNQSQPASALDPCHFKM